MHSKADLAAAHVKAADGAKMSTQSKNTPRRVGFVVPDLGVSGIANMNARKKQWHVYNTQALNKLPTA